MSGRICGLSQSTTIVSALVQPIVISPLAAATSSTLVFPSPVLPHQGSFLLAAEVILLKCNSDEVIS